jgi:hypothetical protein
LLLNAGQQTRRSRTWWRAILDQYGAADVLMPSARLERRWPGGPVLGHFAARYGPDNELIGTFQMEAKSSAAIPDMMKQAVVKMDQLYISALMAGRLRSDPSLVVEEPVAPLVPPKPLEPEKSATDVNTDGLPEPADPVLPLTPPADAPKEAPPEPPKPVASYTIQFDTPDVGSVISGENSVAAVPGVRSARTNSTALGGVSVMRVSFEGDIGALRQGLMARGWRVQGSGNTLRITRR